MPTLSMACLQALHMRKTIFEQTRAIFSCREPAQGKAPTNEWTSPMAKMLSRF